MDMFSLLLGLYLCIELLNHMTTLYLPFEELPDCFLKWLHHFTFFLAVYEGSSFFTVVIVICHFGHSCSGALRWYLIEALILHFPDV